MATALAPPTRVRWGDVDDDEEALPPPSCSGPDARGIKTAVEYRRNERGETVKVTTKTRVSKVERKVYTVSFGGGGAVEGGVDRRAAAFFFSFLLAPAPAPACEERERARRALAPCPRPRSHTSGMRPLDPHLSPMQAAEARRAWPRFGDAAAEAPTDSITVQANEDIPFERVRAAKQTQDERKQAADMKSVLAGSDKSAIGECEWTERESGGERAEGGARESGRHAPPPSLSHLAPLADRAPGRLGETRRRCPGARTHTHTRSNSTVHPTHAHTLPSQKKP
jgi:hypothetical protein